MDIVQLKQMEPIFGSWYVEREIGSGSFGKVYAIYKDDGGFRFRAALKVITIPTNNNDIQELDSQGFDHAAKVRYFDNISAGIMEEIRIIKVVIITQQSFFKDFTLNFTSDPHSPFRKNFENRTVSKYIHKQDT